MTDLITNTTSCMPAFIQDVIPEGLLGRATAGWVAAYRDELWTRRDPTVCAIRDMPGLALHASSGGAFYVFPDVRATGPSEVDFAHRLLTDAGAAVVPGSVSGRQAEGHARIAYAATASAAYGLRPDAAVLEALR